MGAAEQAPQAKSDCARAAFVDKHFFDLLYQKLDPLIRITAVYVASWLTTDSEPTCPFAQEIMRLQPKLK